MVDIKKLFTGTTNQSTVAMVLHILLVTITPFVLAFFLNHTLQRFIKIPKNMQSSRRNTYLSVFKSIIATIIYSMAFFYILSQLKINLTPIFASAGIISIIIGLGIRSLVEDFFSGMFILTQDTVRVGDYVEIGATNGIIETLGFRTIRVKDQNGAVHTLQNREIKKIINYSKHQARVVVDIPIKPNQDIDIALRALKKAMTLIQKDEVYGQILSDGSGIQGVEHIGTGKIIIRVLLLTRPAFRWDIARKYRYLAIQQLEKLKILLA